MRITDIGGTSTSWTCSGASYYDPYKVIGDAWTSFEDLGSTYNLESFTYYVIVGASNVTYKGTHSMNMTPCCDYDYTRCTNCYVETLGYSTATIYTSQNEECPW